MPIETVQPDTILDLQSEPLGRVIVNGPRNTLRVGRDVVLNLTFWLQGSGTTIEIADGCHLTGMIRVVRGEGGLIRIGRGTTFNGVGLSMHEAGEIHVGEDCMFSSDVHMDVSDMHPMYDRTTGLRINPARPIHIDRRVWIGTRVWVNKGARIGEGAVIGAGATVAGEIPPHALAVGTPARVVRTNIDWRREFDDPYQPVPGSTPPIVRRGWLDRFRNPRRPG